MLNFIFRVMLTANATSWMIVVYGIKSAWSICFLPAWAAGIFLLCLPAGLSLVSIGLAACLQSHDEMQNCRECTLADNEFLPVYLGYFFVALSIGDNTTLLYIYGIVFVFTFLTQTQYFNPVFILFGYHFYHIITQQGTVVFIIARGKVIRNSQKAVFSNLRRINDTTYINVKG